MPPFSILWALWARLYSSHFVQELVLYSPPSISQCEQVFVGWKGGQAPYNLEGFSNGVQIFGVSDLTIPMHNLGVVLHGATEGDIVVFRVTDGARSVRYASYRVEPSDDSGCLQGSRGKSANSPRQNPAWRYPSSTIFPMRSQENALASDDSYAQSPFVSSDTTPESGPTPKNPLVHVDGDLS